MPLINHYGPEAGDGSGEVISGKAHAAFMGAGAGHAEHSAPMPKDTPSIEYGLSPGDPDIEYEADA